MRSMTSNSQIAAAYKSFFSLLETGKECKRLHLAAGLSLPYGLEALLDEDSSASDDSPKVVPSTVRERPRVIASVLARRPYKTRELSLVRIPAKPDFGPPPEGAGDDWVPFKAVSASPHALTMAVMRAQKQPLSRAELSNRVSEIRHLKGSNAGYNALGRLVEIGEVSGDAVTGWTLKNKGRGGVISGEYLWSLESELTDADRAAHRREGIVSLLELNRQLQTAEVSRGLQDMPWIKAGANRNFVKADMAQLEREGIVRRLQNKGWELTREDSPPPQEVS